MYMCYYQAQTNLRQGVCILGTCTPSVIVIAMYLVWTDHYNIFTRCASAGGVAGIQGVDIEA